MYNFSNFSIENLEIENDEEYSSTFSLIVNSNAFSLIICTIWMLQFIVGTVGK
jgi:hypothetical protein